MLTIPSAPQKDWIKPPSLTWSTSSHESKGIDCDSLKKQLQVQFPEAEICCESSDTIIGIYINIPNYTKYL